MRTNMNYQEYETYEILFCIDHFSRTCALPHSDPSCLLVANLDHVDTTFLPQPFLYAIYQNNVRVQQTILSLPRHLQITTPMNYNKQHKVRAALMQGYQKLTKKMKMTINSNTRPG